MVSRIEPNNPQSTTPPKKRKRISEADQESEALRKAVRTVSNHALRQSTIPLHFSRQPIQPKQLRENRKIPPNILQPKPLRIILDDDIEVIEDVPIEHKAPVLTKIPIKALKYIKHELIDDNGRCLVNNQLLMYKLFYVGAQSLRIIMINPENQYQLIHSSCSFGEVCELTSI
jgi:hypothetical protein